MSVDAPDPPRLKASGPRRAALLALACAAVAAGAAADEGPAPAPVSIAVFDFELLDGTPAAALQNRATSGAASLEKVTEAARAELQKSGAYRVIDGSRSDAPQVAARALHTCEGCEAAIAGKLGAQQSLLGIVSRATQTDYYIAIQIRDARTGKVLRQESANFAGSEEGWPSGVRMLIRHQVLVTPGEVPPPSAQ